MAGFHGQFVFRFWEPEILFLIIAALIYISSSSVQRFLLSIPSPACFLGSNCRTLHFKVEFSWFQSLKLLAGYIHASVWGVAPVALRSWWHKLSSPFPITSRCVRLAFLHQCLQGKYVTHDQCPLPSSRVSISHFFPCQIALLKSSEEFCL